MSATAITLPGYYVRQILEQVSALALDKAEWLRTFGLRPEQLSDAYLTLDLQTFRQMVRSVLILTQEPGIGLLVGASLLANTHGILGYAAMNSATIRQVVALFEKFMVLRTTLVSLQVQPQANGLFLNFVPQWPLEEVSGVIIEAVVLAIKNVLDFITMGNCQIEAVHFTAATGSQQLAEQLFRCPVAYGMTRDGFLIPLSVVDKPLKMSDPATFADAQQICQRELNRLQPQHLLSVKIRQLLLERQADFPGLEVVARMVFLTPRTLHRHLQREGTSFQQLLEEVRHLLAVEHLKSGRLKIQDIAYTLGYSETASFRRAFKRWEDCSPQDFQRKWLHHCVPVASGCAWSEKPVPDAE